MLIVPHFFYLSVAQRRTIEITYTNDGCLAWDGLGVMRRDQRVNVASDVRKVSCVQTVAGTMRGIC